MIPDSGEIFYKDHYGQIYLSEWSTTDDVTDITTTIKQPYIWGEDQDAFVKDGVLYRLGIVTTIRQLLRIFDGGYEIIADGSDQSTEYIQMNFPCQTGPQDKFAYHLDHLVTNDTEFIMTEGPRWADVDSEEDEEAVWGHVNSDGSVSDPTMTGETTPLKWIDVWE